MQLFNFIRADLASHRPEEISTVGVSSDEAKQGPAYPRSLLLINPLFSAYELNSVNVAAQESIPVPESLDLDAWIVPPPREFTIPDAATEDDTQGGERRSAKKKVKSKGKGKGKEKAPKAATHDPQTDLIPSLGPSETEEDKAEREKVSRSVRTDFSNNSSDFQKLTNSDGWKGWNFVDTTRIISQTDRTRHPLPMTSIPYQSFVWMTSHPCHKVCHTDDLFPSPKLICAS